MSIFKISVDFTNHDWIALRANPEIIKVLTQEDNAVLPEQLKNEINVFENLIKTRFLNPIEKIKNKSVRSGERFSITLMALAKTNN